jgi:hypothetical protein
MTTIQIAIPFASTLTNIFDSVAPVTSAMYLCGWVAR